MEYFFQKVAKNDFCRMLFEDRGQLHLKITLRILYLHTIHKKQMLSNYEVQHALKLLFDPFSCFTGTQFQNVICQKN